MKPKIRLKMKPKIIHNTHKKIIILKIKPNFGASFLLQTAASKHSKCPKDVLQF
jgi:hypothetical protein